MEADRVRQPRFSTANPAIAKQAIQHSQQQQLLLPTDSPSGGQIDEASSGGGPSGVKLVKPFPVKKVPPTATLVDAVSKSPAVDGGGFATRDRGNGQSLGAATNTGSVSGTSELGRHSPIAANDRPPQPQDGKKVRNGSGGDDQRRSREDQKAFTFTSPSGSADRKNSNPNSGPTAGPAQHQHQHQHQVAHIATAAVDFKLDCINSASSVGGATAVNPPRNAEEKRQRYSQWQQQQSSQRQLLTEKEEASRRQQQQQQQVEADRRRRAVAIAEQQRLKREESETKARQKREEKEEERVRELEKSKRRHRAQVSFPQHERQQQQHQQQHQQLTNIYNDPLFNSSTNHTILPQTTSPITSHPY